MQKEPHRGCDADVTASSSARVSATHVNMKPWPLQKNISREKWGNKHQPAGVAEVNVLKLHSSCSVEKIPGVDVIFHLRRETKHLQNHGREKPQRSEPRMDVPLPPLQKVWTCFPCRWKRSESSCSGVNGRGVVTTKQLLIYIIQSSKKINSPNCSVRFGKICSFNRIVHKRDNTLLSHTSSTAVVWILWWLWTDSCTNIVCFFTSCVEGKIKKYTFWSSSLKDSDPDKWKQTPLLL